MTLSKKTKIVFIGAGKIASSLAPAMIKSGYNVSAVISRNIKAAKKLAVKYKTLLYSDNFEMLNNFKGIIFLTVPDSSLESLAEELSRQKLLFRDCFFVHTSGALSSSALNSLQKKKSLTASLHILQSFPSIEKKDITGSYSAVESSFPEAVNFLKKLSKSLFLIPFELNKKEKIRYHLAAVFASNFINAALYGSAKLFGGIRNIPAEHYKVFEPIITSVIDNIKKDGAVMALSGPIERGDIKTIKEHLSLLKQSDMELYSSYIANSFLLIEAASEKYSRQDGKELPNKEEMTKLLLKELCQ